MGPEHDLKLLQHQQPLFTSHKRTSLVLNLRSLSQRSIGTSHRAAFSKSSQCRRELGCIDHYGQHLKDRLSGKSKASDRASRKKCNVTELRVRKLVPASANTAFQVVAHSLASIVAVDISDGKNIVSHVAGAFRKILSTFIHSWPTSSAKLLISLALQAASADAMIDHSDCIALSHSRVATALQMR